jgi:anti-anti-sigma regulatory factor
MMKVHTSNNQDRVILRVEGRLAGAYVGELERCWKEASALEPSRPISLDLRDVTCVDPAGGYLLRLMHSQGVEVVRTNLALQDVLERVQLRKCN